MDRCEGLVGSGLAEAELDLLICQTCGTQQPVASSARTVPPEACKICIDPRQFVNAKGQQWTTLRKMLKTGQGASIEPDPVIKGAYSVKAEPSFAIDEHMIMFVREDGVYLWDCFAALCPETLAAIKSKGRVQGIFLSHPHFQTTSLGWARTLGCKVYASAIDREWYLRADDPTVNDLFVFLDGPDAHHFPLAACPYNFPGPGEAPPTPEPTFTVVRLGGHFDGSAVGYDSLTKTLVVGDTVFVTPRLTCSFMWSIPNMVPLPVSKIAEMLHGLSKLPFKNLLGLSREKAIYAGRPIRDGTDRPVDADEVVWASARLHARQAGADLGSVANLH